MENTARYSNVEMEVITLDEEEEKCELLLGVYIQTNFMGISKSNYYLSNYREDLMP